MLKQLVHHQKLSGRNTLLVSHNREVIPQKKKLAEPRMLGCTTGQHMYYMLVLDVFSSIVSLLQGSRRWQMKDDRRFGAYASVPLVHANTTILQHFQMCKNWEVIQCDSRVYIHQGYMDGNACSCGQRVTSPPVIHRNHFQKGGAPRPS